MFRRFMIVCWVLFGILLSAAMFSYVRAEHFAGEYGHAFSEVTEIAIDPSYYRLDKSTPEGVLKDLAYQHKLAPLKRKMDRSQRLQDSWESYTEISLFAVGLMILTIGISYISHWIWMGRKAE